VVELANRRLVIMANIGMCFLPDDLTGSAYGNWALYTASPLRSFESELGVQPPAAFWDPVGFTRDEDEAALERIQLRWSLVASMSCRSSAPWVRIAHSWLIAMSREVQLSQLRAATSQDNTCTTTVLDMVLSQALRLSAVSQLSSTPRFR
jgi:hypothetical protein